MVTLYNKSEIVDSFLEEKWELLWQLNLNILCRLQNFKLCYIYHYYLHISEVNELHERHKILLHNELCLIRDGLRS